MIFFRIFENIIFDIARGAIQHTLINTGVARAEDGMSTVELANDDTQNSWRDSSLLSLVSFIIMTQCLH